MIEKVKEMIKRHEGFRTQVYLDSLGKPTAGYGHHLYVGSYFPQEVADIFFERDFNNAMIDLERLCVIDASIATRAVLVDMIFNMGFAGVSAFKNMLRALRDKDFDTAAKALLDSVYAKQVGKRAIELANILRTQTV